MATKTATRILVECNAKLADSFTRGLLKADLIAKIGPVNWAVATVRAAGADPIRKGLFANAWCRAAGGTEEQALEAELRANARHQRAIDRRIAERARRGGNVYEVSGRRGHRAAKHVCSAVFRKGHKYTVYCSGGCIPGTQECFAPRKYRVGGKSSPASV